MKLCSSCKRAARAFAGHINQPRMWSKGWAALLYSKTRAEKIFTGRKQSHWKAKLHFAQKSITLETCVKVMTQRLST